VFIKNVHIFVQKKNSERLTKKHKDNNAKPRNKHK